MIFTRTYFADKTTKTKPYLISTNFPVSFRRTSLSDAWKTNTASATVEEVALTERYKLWADECSALFGGLDIVCVEVIHTKDDKEYIIEVKLMLLDTPF